MLKFEIMEIHENVSIREPARFVISAILIPAECHPCSKNIARSINQSLVRSFVIESRITPFSRVLLGPARTRSPDYPIGTGFPFVDRHSSVFSRRILFHLPLVLMCSRERRVLPSFSRGPLGTKGLAEKTEEDGRFTRGQRRPSGGVKR